MASRLFFNGQLYSTPSTVSSVDDSAEAPTNPSIGNSIAYIGQSTGGLPGTVLRFGSPKEASAALVSGELLDAVTKAFAPSSQTGGPGTVKAIHVGPATQAAAILLDANRQPSIYLISRAFGPAANATQVKIEAGTLTGLRVTTALGNSYYVGDNLADDLFTLAYTGTSAATVSVTATSIILGVAGVVAKTVDLPSSGTIGSVAAQINGVSGFVAASLPAEAAASVSRLDALGTTTVTTTPLTLRGQVAAVLDFLNGGGSPLVGGIAAGSAVAPPALTPYVTLAGGAALAPLLADWVQALQILQGEDVQWIVALTGDPAVHAALDAHVQYMSTIGRRERRAFAGPPANTPLSVAINLPKALNSDRTSLVWPGYYDFDSTGALTLYAPYMTAGIVAAGFAGLPPGDAMTNKAIAVRGLEASIRNPTDTDPAIQAGLLVVEDTQQGFKVVRSLSTWLVNDNYNRVEVSCGAATDYMVAFVRLRLDVLRGGRQDPRQLARAISITQSALSELAVPAPIGPGVIVGDAKSPPFRNIAASLQGDIIHVTWEASPVIPTNFITASVAIVPYSGTAAA